MAMRRLYEKKPDLFPLFLAQNAVHGNETRSSRKKGRKEKEEGSLFVANPEKNELL